MLKAGAGKVDITPPLGTRIGGCMRPKGFEGVHDKLFAKAVFVESQDEYFGIITSPLIAVPKKLVQATRQEIEKNLGIDGKKIMVTAYHNHSGPAVREEYSVVSPQVLAKLPGQLAQAMTEAYRNRGSVYVEISKSHEDRIAHNRRIKMKNGQTRMNWENLNLDEVSGPLGPVDPEVGVLHFVSKDKKTVATLVNYACHAAVLAGNNFLVSEDFPGIMMRRVEHRLGGICLFTNGAAGDVNHIELGNLNQPRDFNEVERLGSILADAVFATVEKARPIESNDLKIIRREIEIARRPISKELAEWAKKNYNPDLDLQQAQEDGLSDQRVAGQILKLLHENRKTELTEIQVMCLDSVAMVSVPGELFVEFSLQIKKSSPFATTMVIGYANDYLGYLPTEQAFDQGGYEVQTAASSRMSKNAGKQITASAIHLLETVFERT